MFGYLYFEFSLRYVFSTHWRVIVYLCLSFTIMSFPCCFIFMIRLLWDCMMLDANSYPEVAFSRKELYLVFGIRLQRKNVLMCDSLHIYENVRKLIHLSWTSHVTDWFSRLDLRCFYTGVKTAPQLTHITLTHYLKQSLD